jgi:alpha-beta hydrolase superfamily lysophospholipase
MRQSSLTIHYFFLRTLVYVFLFVSVVLTTSCTHLIFGPMRPQIYTPDLVDLEYDDLYAITGDGLKLHGWKLHAKSDLVGSLIFFHGNGENISTHFGNVYWMAEHGYDVYLFDYRGYGQSEGEPQLDAIIDDYDVMLEAVIQQLPDDQKLVVMGHSFGASLSIYGVAHSRYRNRIAALISFAAFADYHDVTREILSRSWLTWALQWPLSYTIDNTYRPLDSVALVSPIPLYLVHSREDEIIALHHVKDLYAAAEAPKALIEIDGDHNNALRLEANRDWFMLILDEIKTLSPCSDIWLCESGPVDRIISE